MQSNSAEDLSLEQPLFFTSHCDYISPEFTTQIFYQYFMIRYNMFQLAWRFSCNTKIIQNTWEVSYNIKFYKKKLIFFFTQRVIIYKDTYYYLCNFEVLYILLCKNIALEVLAFT
jgi:hypothetical protein